ncbi:hypothetical protein VLK81_05840 [Citroniella saccharovorans]|uniref:Lipoprotein n=1 Tax=Citroniella saccharovorans TaxID=2053367 RepID=A0AAW9MU55_9FIRM|nr:hypothetical protein [Citroniella saccharovorans]MEB3429535.1 hypothetical protein [Citroniella saccharovorans]
MKKYKIFIILFLIFLLSSCKSNSKILDQVNLSESIVSPNDNKSPIEGTYKLTSKIFLVQKNEELEKKYKNTDLIYISNNLVQIDDRFTISPSFKSRFFNFLDYTKYKLNDTKINASNIDIDGTILTISDGQYFYQDIYLINENNITLLYDGILFSFKKVSEGVPKDIIDKANEIANNEVNNNIEKNISEYPSILIGVTSPKKDSNDNLTYVYKTYFIEIKDKSYIDVVNVDDIIYPRDQGFWKIGIEHKMGSDSSFDQIYAFPLAQGDKVTSRYNLGNKKNIQISFIGKDFIGIENTEYTSSDKTYGLFNYSNIENNKKSNIIEIAGEDGLKVMQDEIIKNLPEKVDSKKVEEFYDPENIGIRRNNGKWEFKTNIIIKKENGEAIIKDIKLPINPIIDIFSNNKLSITWESIKNKVPGAIDAYTSIDDRLLLVQNLNELLIYEIDRGVISKKHLGSIKFAKDDRIISCVFSSPKSNKLWKNTLISQKPMPKIIMDE